MQPFIPFPDYSGGTPRPDVSALRASVRAFLEEERRAGTIVPGLQSWTTFDRGFSERAARRSFLALTWPKRFGGQERTAFERYVVCEEMLAAGAPLGSHWIAERQSGPQIMRHGTEELKAALVHRIAAGQLTFGIGMSEPDSGSDLSSVRTKAEKVEGGWRMEGRKVWTTNAHHADYLIVLCRTEARSEDRYAGLSQMVVPLDDPRVTVRPLVSLNGEHELNEVIFDCNVVPDTHLLGQGGDGWKLVIEELAFERSAPDRFMSTFGLLRILAEAVGVSGDDRAHAEVGRLVARLSAIRDLSLLIGERLEAGQNATGIATIAKDLGTGLEQEIPEVARRVLSTVPVRGRADAAGALSFAILNAPCFSLRGGTREILKGIVARELGLR